MSVATLNTWVEAPKNCNISSQIRRYCIEQKITIHSLTSESVHRGLFDTLLGINRETVYFHLEGSYTSLNGLKEMLKKHED